jgi:HNH endonuclease
MARFRDIDIHEFGNEILLSGAIYAAGDRVYACFFPDSGDEKDLPIESLAMDRDEWIAVLAQLDALDVKVVDGTGEKAILRKSARIVDNNVSWAVFRRDGYACRYCGANEVPLSVDHLVLWEQGGPWTMANLVACCKRDNKKRGQKSYADWLRDPYYLKLSQRLSPEQRAANEALLGTLDAIPRVKNLRSR